MTSECLSADATGAAKDTYLFFHYLQNDFIGWHCHSVQVNKPSGKSILISFFIGVYVFDGSSL